MDFLLAWYNLIFLLPILMGIVAALAATSGLGIEAGDSDSSGVETESEASHGCDTDSDTDTPDHAVEVHSDGNLFERALSLLGVGRVPLSIVITVSSLTFGVTGILLNSLLLSLVKIPTLIAGVSVLGSFTVMFLITGALSRWLSKILPSVESYGISHSGLEGRVGTLVLAANTEFGVVHVVDEYHQLHRIQCKTFKGTIPEGTEVIIIKYEESEKVYYVEAMSAWRLETSRNKNEAQTLLVKEDGVDKKEKEDITSRQNNYEGTKS